MRGRGRTSRVGAGAARADPTGGAGPGAAAAGAGGAGPPGRAGPRRAGGRDRLPDRPGREQHPAARRRCSIATAEHLRLRGRRRRGGHAGRAPDRPAVGPLPPAPGASPSSGPTCSSWPCPAWSSHSSFTYVTEHFLQGRFYQTSPLLVLAYAIMFFPLAVVSVRAAVARSPVGLEEVGGSLGVRRRSVLWRVTLPLIGPGLGRRVRARLPGDGDRADGHARPPSRPTSRRWPRSSGPTSRTSPTARRRRTPVSWCSSPRCPATSSAAGSTASPTSERHGRRPAAAPHRAQTGGGMKDLRITGVTKSFGPQRVLRGVDLTVPHGSFTAILGASGSGKTTLLRIVAGFERPDEGEVSLGERGGRRRRAAASCPREHRRIGYVPQEGALFPHLSVGRNVGFGLAPRPGPRGPGRRAARARRAVRATAGATRTSSPGASSSGSPWPVPWRSSPRSSCSTSPSPRSTPRCAPRSAPTCCGVLRQAGTTSILVTHDQDEALSMADQVAVLRHGVIAQLDTPAGLYGHPADAELAQFLGESNVLEGEVRDGTATTGARAASPSAAWSGPAGGGTAQVMVRPEQIALGEPATGELEGDGGELRVLRPRRRRAGPARARGSARTWSCGSRAARRSSRGTGSGSPCSAPSWPGRRSRSRPAKSSE